MARLLFQIVSGPENTTRAALGLLVARTAAAQGHEVTVFIAGDAVDFARSETRDASHGVGTGAIAEHWAALQESGARILGSGMSARVRGLGSDTGVELVMPDRLVALIEEADKVLVY
jgi:predicted peroxiredoxin